MPDKFQIPYRNIGSGSTILVLKVLFNLAVTNFNLKREVKENLLLSPMFQFSTIRSSTRYRYQNLENCDLIYLCFQIFDEALYLDRAVPHEEKNVLNCQDLVRKTEMTKHNKFLTFSFQLGFLFCYTRRYHKNIKFSKI